jgi:hypothetical protein
MKNSKSDSTGVQVARLLRALATLVEKSDPDEVAAFLRSRATALSIGVEGHAQKGIYARATAPPPISPNWRTNFEHSIHGTKVTLSYPRPPLPAGNLKSSGGSWKRLS